MDVVRLVGAVTREVSSREVDGKPARVVVASRAYDTDLDDLWDALTNKERLVRWMGPVRGDLRLGGRYSVENNASGRITTCEPPTHLAVTWEFQGDTSWVDVQLEAREGACLLRLEHVAHVPEPFWGEYGPGATGVGWELALLALEGVVAGAGGTLVDDEAAFAASPEGRRFVQSVSAAWGAASIADGTDETAAREAAARTTAFYGA